MDIPISALRSITPDTPMDRSVEALAVWRRGMEALAAHPNVWCKLSGLPVLGAPYTVMALAQLGCQQNVVGLVPLCENMPSSRAVKPGDVVVAKNGKSIEVQLSIKKSMGKMCINTNLYTCATVIVP